MRWGVDVRLNNSLLRSINNVRSKTEEVLDKKIDAFCDEVVSKAVSRVPKKTGALSRSITKVRRASLQYKVGAYVHYAPYVEWGTGTLVDVPTELKSYAILYKGRGIKQVNLPAHPYLFNSVEEERIKLFKDLKKNLSKEIRRS